MKITAYEFGRIEIEGKTYTSDVIISSEKVTDDWRRKDGHKLHMDDLADIVAAKPEVLVIGTGYYGRMSIPDETKMYLESKGIEFKQAKTSSAIEEYNRLQRGCARIVAALHLTC